MFTQDAHLCLLEHCIGVCVCVLWGPHFKPLKFKKKNSEGLTCKHPSCAKLYSTNECLTVMNVLVFLSH